MMRTFEKIFVTPSLLIFLVFGIYVLSFLSKDLVSQSRAQTKGELEVSVEVPFTEEMKNYVRVNSSVVADPVSVKVGEGSRIIITIMNYTEQPLEGAEVKISSESPDAIVFQPGSPTDENGITYGFITSEVESEIFVTASVEVHEEIIPVKDTAKVDFFLDEEEQTGDEDVTQVEQDTSEEVEDGESFIGRLPITSGEELEEYLNEFVDSSANNIQNYTSDNPYSAGLAASVPMVTATSTVLASSGATFFEIPNLIIRVFVWISNLLGMRKKYKPWGRIYDSVSKLPISMAVVRIYREDKLVGTSVTDVNGVFSAKIQNGKYLIKVKKKGYQFPSEIINTSVDGLKKNVYTGGGTLEIEEQEIHNLSIPLDPIDLNKKTEFLSKLKSKASLIITRLNPVLAITGGFLSFILYLNSSDVINLILSVLYCSLFVVHLVTRFSYRRKIGVVHSTKGRRISGLKLGLYDPTYDKLVDYAITDSNGEYRFVVPGNYYLLRPVGENYVIKEESHKEGYLVGKKTDDVISINRNIKLRKT